MKLVNTFYAIQTLRANALYFKDFPSWPLPGIQVSAVNKVRVFAVMF
jgi:hypothetical protein